MEPNTAEYDLFVDETPLLGEDAELALSAQDRFPAVVSQTLVSQGLMSEEQLARVLATQYGLPYEPLADFRVDPRFYRTISVELMHRHPFVPLGERDEMLVIAMPDPNNFSALDELEMLLKRPLQLAVSTRAAILAALSRSEGSSQTLKEIEAEYRPLLVREDDQGEEENGEEEEGDTLNQMRRRRSRA